MPPKLGVQFWGASWGHDNELSTKFWGSGLTYKRVGALEAKIAQHVASELRMRFCSPRWQTDRNTPG